MTDSERSARGAAIQQEITGRAVPRPATLFEESWRDFVFAEVWSRPGLDRRARYLIAIAGAALSGAADAVLDGYVQGALRNGELTLGELREVAFHMAVYGGWSRGGVLDAAVSRAAQALGLPAADWAPVPAPVDTPEQRTELGQAEFVRAMAFSGGPSISPLIGAINDFVFAELWAREAGLDQRSRRWLTLVGVCESCADIPMRSHIHAAMASGNCSPDEMQEFALQFAIHAGWPKASVVQTVVWAMAKKVAEGLPWNG